MKIFVKVKTQAKVKKIVKVDGTHYHVFTNAPPEKGKANKDIIKILSKYFDISVSRIKIITGDKSREKIIELIS
jgi:uncharacterized protein (TIGR00251 family)